MPDSHIKDASDEEGCIADSSSDHEEVVVLPPPPPNQTRRSQSRAKRKQPDSSITYNEISLLYDNRLQEAPATTMDATRQPAPLYHPQSMMIPQSDSPPNLMKPTFMVPSSQYPGMMVMLVPQEMMAQGATHLATMPPPYQTQQPLYMMNQQPLYQQPLHQQPMHQQQSLGRFLEGIQAQTNFTMQPPQMIAYADASVDLSQHPGHSLPGTEQCSQQISQSPMQFQHSSRMMHPVEQSQQPVFFQMSPQVAQHLPQQHAPSYTSPSLLQRPNGMHQMQVFQHSPQSSQNLHQGMVQIQHSLPTAPLMMSQRFQMGEQASQGMQQAYQLPLPASQTQQCEMRCQRGSQRNDYSETNPEGSTLPESSHPQTTRGTSCRVPPPHSYRRLQKGLAQYKGQLNDSEDLSRRGSRIPTAHESGVREHEDPATCGDEDRSIQQDSRGTQKKSAPPPPTECVPPPPPQSRSETYCLHCDREFRTKSQFEIHVNEDHEMCDVEKCDWSGPPSLLLVHKITHVTDEKGTPLSQSNEETRLWLEARARAREDRQKGGVPKGEKQSVQLSALEKYLRSSVVNGKGSCPPMRKNMTLWRKRRGLSLIPTVGRYIKHFEGKRLEALKGPTVGRNGDKIRLFEEFPICEAFLRHRACRYGNECRQSHDVKGYQDWQVNRLKSGIKVKQRAMNVSSILYELLYSEVASYEDTLLKCLRAVHENNFWLDQIAG